MGEKDLATCGLDRRPVRKSTNEWRRVDGVEAMISETRRYNLILHRRGRQRVLPALDPAPRAVAERGSEQAAPVRPGSPLFHALAHRPIDNDRDAANFQTTCPCLDGLGMVWQLLQSENTEQSRVFARGGHRVFDGARKSRIPFAAFLRDLDHTCVAATA